MAVIAAQIALSTTPARVDTRRYDDTGRVSVAFYAGVDCYVGPAGVSSTTGFLLPANQTLTYERDKDTDELWAVLASGTGTGYMLEV